MSNCYICEHPLATPLPPLNVAVDSLCRTNNMQATLYFCQHCGHLQKQGLTTLAEYYSNDYNIATDSEEEDQLYAVIDGINVYRTDHQLRVMLEKLALPHNAKVLDYGCGKGAMLNKLSQQRNDIQAHLFDVSDAYLPFWEQFIPANQWATFALNPDWFGTMDCVTSFFSLEHVPQLSDMLNNIHQLLKPDGTFYCVVPNPYGIYQADVLVVDHVNHFSPLSLTYLLQRYGFTEIDIDPDAHNVAYVITARKQTTTTTPAPPATTHINALATQATRMIEFWTAARARITTFEQQHNGQTAAIYGAGVCGNFIAGCLENTDNIQCFIDQNPFKQAQGFLGKPVLPPTAIAETLKTIYVGLNPAVGPAAIANVPALQTVPRDYFYL